MEMSKQSNYYKPPQELWCNHLEGNDLESNHLERTHIRLIG